jgi:hypothetical protein
MGFSNHQAALSQFRTAMAALKRTGAGLVLQGSCVGNFLMWLMAVGFVYLAFCTIIPEFLEAPGGFQF